MNMDRDTDLMSHKTDRDQLFPSVDVGETLRDLMMRFRRHWAVLVVGVASAVVLALIMVSNASPTYTANGAILIDPRVGQSPDGDSDIAPGLLLSDALTVDSELRVLGSREVTAATVRELGLGEPRASEPSALLGWIKGVFRIGDDGDGDATVAMLPEDMQQERLLEIARRNFVQGLAVERSGESFVIDVRYTSQSIEMAPRAVNALMREYLRLSSRQQTANVERTQVWLSSRIEELAAGVQASERAVASYRRENQLMVPEGEFLPIEIALNAANEQLVELQGQAVTAKVQADQLEDQIESGEIEAIQLAPEERTEAVTEFEARYAELLQAEQEALLTYDESAPVVVNTRRAMEQTRSLIVQEYRSILEQLRARERALAGQLSATREMIGEMNADYSSVMEKTVALRSLEREAEAKRELYERMLEQYNSTSQLLTFDATPARVIAWAVPPDTKSGPRSKRIVVLAAFAGLLLSIGVVLAIEALDNSFRSQGSLSKRFNLPFIGVVPNFTTERKEARGGGWLTPPDRSPRWRMLPSNAKRLRFAMDNPRSVTATTMRAIMVREAMERKSDSAEGVVIGFTSTVRDEGKTTTAFNFASYLAANTNKVAIVDLDLIAGEITSYLGKMLPESNNLTKLMENPAEGLSHAEGIDEFPGLAVFGNSREGSTIQYGPRELEEIANVLRFLRRYFDYVVVDLPPVSGASLTPMLASNCDKIIYVVRWGWTARKQVSSALEHSGLRRKNLMGLLFTRANLRRYKSYNRDGSYEYY
ncbi:MAG: hypothetical protein CMI67_16290 [Pelagibaca sp.]|nr:hypothetical protein [Pelagibaca sp.]